MPTAAAGFHVPGKLLTPAVLEAGVSLQIRKQTTARGREAELLEPWCGRVQGTVIALERIRELDERLFDLTGEYRVDAVLAQVVGVESRVETIEGQMTPGIEGADALGDVHPQPERRVHGYGEGDQSCTPHLLGIKRLDREVQHVRRIPRTFQEGDRPGDGKGLVTQLITGDEQDRARLVHGPSVRRVRCNATFSPW